MSILKKARQALRDAFNQKRRLIRDIDNFLLAAEQGDLVTLEKYFNTEGFLDQNGPTAQLAMVAAAKQGNMSSVIFLLKKDVPATSAYSMLNYQGKSSATLAAEAGHADVADLLRRVMFGELQVKDLPEDCSSEGLQRQAQLLQQQRQAHKNWLKDGMPLREPIKIGQPLQFRPKNPK